MPSVIYATPRGSGTLSGVYVDIPLGDEPRGEHKYIKPNKATWIGEHVERGWIAYNGQLFDPESYEIVEKKP